MLKGDDPFFGLAEIPAEEFPAGAFAIVCGIVGGAANHFLSHLIFESCGWYFPKLETVAAVAGLVGGVAFALRFTVYLADRE